MTAARHAESASSESLSRPSVESMAKGAFWLMIKRVAVVAGMIDILMFVLFQALRMPLLAWMNVASVAMYVAAYALLERRRNLPAVLLMWCEVLTHSAVCSVLLGWDSGVHYFMMVFIPAIALSRSGRHAAGALLFLLLVYLGTNAVSMAVPPIYRLPPSASIILRCTSISAVFLMFGYMGRYYVGRVSEAERQLQQLAALDVLSGLANRRQITLSADVELQRANRQGTAVAVLMADIDHFKQVNDRWGHSTGDRLIQHIAALMSACLRPTDIIGRWGGEEFIALLPGTSPEEASAIAERLRAAIAASGLEVEGRLVHITVSVGVQPVDLGKPFCAAVAGADAAMYLAKNQGRNTVVVATAS